MTERLSVGRGEELKYLDNYYGINIKEKEKCNMDDLMMCIEDEISRGQIMLLLVDTYWCFWMTGSYLKNSNTHYVIVNGYDVESKRIFVQDTQMAVNGVWIEKEEFEKLYMNIYTIRNNSDTRDLDFDILFETLCNRVNDKKLKWSEQIRHFANDIIHMDYDREIDVPMEMISTAKIYQLIYQIGCSRYKFMLALEQINNELEERYCEIDTLINDMERLHKTWNEVFAMLVKSSLVKDNSKIKQRIYDRLLSIANNEEKVEENIINWKLWTPKDKDDALGLMQESRHVSKAKNPFFLNIRKYYNSNALYNLATLDCKSSMDIPGRYFVPDFKVENGVLSNDIYSFKINNYDNDNDDNIICLGQHIHIEPFVCQSLSFLLCSEFGGFEEKIVIHYTDHTSEKVHISTMSWLSPQADVDKNEYFKGSVVVRNETSIVQYPFKVGLYTWRAALQEKNKAIKTIELPICENIHIFSITGEM
jgi:hypothetical protein